MPTNTPYRPPYDVTYGESTTYQRAWVVHHAGARIVYVGPRGDGAPAPMTRARRIAVARDFLAHFGADVSKLSDADAERYSHWLVREDDLTVRTVRTEHTIGDRTITYGVDYTTRMGGGTWTANVTYRAL